MMLCDYVKLYYSSKGGMTDMKNRTDVTSADTKQLGFEYQYLYFILKLLQMRYGDEVGYEARDDIHVVSSSTGNTQYIQVKHTTDLAADGTPSNLTNLSEDLWQTLSNWAKLITDPAEQRNTTSAQTIFVSDAEFIFATNRNTLNNDIATLVANIHSNTIDIATVKSKILEVKQSTSSAVIRTYIDDVLDLSDDILDAFLGKVFFISCNSNLFDDIRNEIRYKMIAEENVDDVLCRLYTQLKEDFFNKVKNKTHQVIRYNEWQRKYQPVFNSVRTTLLPIRSYQPALPDRLDQQPFVKELIEIEAVDPDKRGLSELAEFTEHYLSIKLQMMDWYDEGKIDLTTMNNFHKDAQVLWKRIHRSCHRSTKSDLSLDRENALACFDQIMQERLTLLSTDLGISLSNGEFILLANDEKIGWRYKWSI